MDSGYARRIDFSNSTLRVRSRLPRLSLKEATWFKEGQVATTPGPVSPYCTRSIRVMLHSNVSCSPAG